MPLYEYECSACGHRFERIQKRDARGPRCPECGGRTRRLLSPPAIHFKGGGWYVTDYARKGKGGDTDKPAAGEAKDKPGASESKDKKAAKGGKGGGAAPEGS